MQKLYHSLEPLKRQGLYGRIWLLKGRKRMIADGAQPTAARLFLVQFSCFHEALALRGEKETKLRQATLAAAQSILAYQGEQRRLAFMLVAAANITGDPGTTYDTPGVYLVADMLAAIHQSLDQLKMSFAQK